MNSDSIRLVSHWNFDRNSSHFPHEHCRSFTVHGKRRFSEVKTITSKEKDELVSKQDDHGEVKKNQWGFDGSYRLGNYLVVGGLEFGT